MPWPSSAHFLGAYSFYRENPAAFFRELRASLGVGVEESEVGNNDGDGEGDTEDPG